MKIPQADVSVQAALTEWNLKGDLVASFCQKKRTVIQAGGHIGVFPIGLSKLFSRVVCFEPFPETFRFLESNIGAGIEARMECLGKCDGFSSASKIDPQNLGITRFVADESGAVKTTAIDNLHIDDVDLIWLDVEGCEQDALIGAAETIKECSPVIVVENKGLTPGFESGLEGSAKFRDWVSETFDYLFVERTMRDDIFLR